MTLVQRGAARLIEASDISEGTVEYLRESVGVKQVGYRDTITVRAPDMHEAAFFGFRTMAGFRDRAPPDRLRRRRPRGPADGQRLPADRNQFAVIVGQVPDRPGPPTPHPPRPPRPSRGVADAGFKASAGPGRHAPLPLPRYAG